MSYIQNGHSGSDAESQGWFSSAAMLLGLLRECSHSSREKRRSRNRDLRKLPCSCVDLRSRIRK